MKAEPGLPGQTAFNGPSRFWGGLARSLRGALGSVQKARSLAEAALSAYVANRRALSDGNDGDGNSAVPKTGPNIPKPNTVATEANLGKAGRGSPAGDS